MASRYEVYFLVLKTIFYSRAALIRKILFLPLENKNHIFAPPCNILHVSLAPSSSKRTKIPTHKPISMRQVTLKTERKETPYFQLFILRHSQTTFLVTELRVSYRDRADRNGTRLFKTRTC